MAHPIVGGRVRIVGFASLPKANYNNLVATIVAYNPTNGKVIARLESDDWLVLMNKHHVEHVADTYERRSDAMETPNINRVDDCAICLASMASTQRVQTYCAHVFHEGCLERWIRTNHGRAPCPMCRVDVCASKPHALVVRSIDSVCRTHALTVS